MRLKVLLVEDDLPTLEMMREVLTQLGVDVYLVSDSHHAATLVNQEKYDGIFLDLMMPGIDGLELARLVRRSSWNKRTPIAVITGKEDKDTIQQAFQAGATFFLNKPIDKGKLSHLLSSARGPMTAERRRFARVPLRTTVECVVGSRKVTGTSVNISQSGLLFEGDGSLLAGNVGSLSLTLPGQRLPIKAEAVVVRTDEKQRVGLRFTQISVEDLARIGDLVTLSEESTR